MKTLLKITLFIAFVSVFASCQTSKQILSNQDTKSAIMDSIVNDSNLSKEMLGLMLNGRNSDVIMGEIHETMMKKMKNKPGMMRGMMTGMMETYKGDSAMMSSMCMSMMENPEMMEMMHKKMGGKMDMKVMKGMNMEGMDHKMK